MAEPIPIEDPPEPSPERKILTQYLISRPHENLEDYINLIAIVYGVRQGVIVAIHPSGLVRFMIACGALGIIVRKYPMGNPMNVILVRGGDPKVLSSLPGLMETNTPEFHRLTGELLGYFEPYDIFNLEIGATKNIGVSLEFKVRTYTGKQESTSIFAQRVSSGEPYRERLEAMAEAMRTLDPAVYLPYRLESVDVRIQPRGGYHRKKQSKARRNRKSRKTRRR